MNLVVSKKRLYITFTQCMLCNLSAEKASHIQAERVISTFYADALSRYNAI